MIYLELPFSRVPINESHSEEQVQKPIRDGGDRGGIMSDEIVAIFVGHARERDAFPRCCIHRPRRRRRRRCCYSPLEQTVALTLYSF